MSHGVEVGEGVTMGVMVILTDGEDLEVRPGAEERLADLGVTTVAIVSGGTRRGIVLQGWSFDARSSGGEAAEIVAGEGGPVELLVPNVELAVRKTADSSKGDGR